MELGSSISHLEGMLHTLYINAVLKADLQVSYNRDFLNAALDHPTWTYFQ